MMRVLKSPAVRLAAGVSVLALMSGAAHAQNGPSFEVYGFAQADFTQDFNRVDPLWDDALRPSKIPTTEGIFGDDGQTSFSVKQSRFGVQASQDVAGDTLFVKFEFDMFGVGDHAGDTHMRLRHFYGQWGPILAGQTNTLFMDGDIFPNTIEYWGPNGMAFVRNPQIRYTYKSGPSSFAVALEKPSNDIDVGNIRLIDPDLAGSIQGDEKLPDLTAQYRYVGDWGHFQIAGLLRQIGYETAGTAGNEPKGHETGWGVDLTGNIKTFQKDVIHLGVVYGDGIATYMNDGGMDLAPKATPVIGSPIVGAPVLGLEAKAVPLLGLTAYYDHYWNDTWSSSIGWSQVKVDNTNFQEGSAFRTAQYASANILWQPDKRLLFGAEFIWGFRQDKDGAKGEDNRIQFSAKYSFSSNDFK